MGTAAIAAPVLEELAGSAQLRLVGVVSQPDRPAGRNRRMTPSPVSETARKLGLPLLTPEHIGDAAAVEWLRRLEPDVAVVFAFGQFLPRAVRDLPRFRSINIPPSRLPLHRGAAPIPWAIAGGEDSTAVSIIRMEKEMDAGDVLACRDLEIRPEDTSETLGARAATLGAELVLETLRAMEAGTLAGRPQDPALATHARKLEKSDARIDWTLPATAIHNRLRAFDPWPGVGFPSAANPGELVKVWQTRVESASGVPGTVLELGREGPLIACGRDAIRLLIVQPPGKRRMPGADFARGAGWTAGQGLTA